MKKSKFGTTMLISTALLSALSALLFYTLSREPAKSSGNAEFKVTSDTQALDCHCRDIACTLHENEESEQ